MRALTKNNLRHVDPLRMTLQSTQDEAETRKNGARNLGAVLPCIPL